MPRPSKKWFDANTAWRLDALAQIKQWVEENDQGPYDKFAHKIVLKHFQKLETFIWAFFPDAPPAPFDSYDAAALIVLPRYEALRLARKLFGGGPGITKDLQADDLWFNLDWFRPRGFQ